MDIELNDLDERRDEDEVEREQETEFNDTDSDLLDGLDWLSNKGKDPLKKNI